MFLDSLSNCHNVAKRFIFASQQRRFSQLDDVIENCPARRTHFVSSAYDVQPISFWLAANVLNLNLNLTAGVAGGGG